MNIIKANSNKYSISAMCKCLEVARNTYYYEVKEIKIETILENSIIKIFRKSRNNYGTRKIKFILQRDYKTQVSRKKIARIMAKYGLISTYTVKSYKKHLSKVNNDKIENIVEREFNGRERLEVVVSDLTYVNVKGKWNYICVLLDLYNREIIGFATSKKKNAQIVEEAFMKSNVCIGDIEIFHTDCGSEFKNNIIGSILKTFEIRRSLSKKGCPYDNTVAEAGFKVIKTEFVQGRIFESMEELKNEFFDYVNWYNNHRIHGALGYETPISYLEKVSL